MYKLLLVFILFFSSIIFTYASWDNDEYNDSQIEKKIETRSEKDIENKIEKKVENKVQKKVENKIEKKSDNTIVKKTNKVLEKKQILKLNIKSKLDNKLNNYPNLSEVSRTKLFTNMLVKINNKISKDNISDKQRLLYGILKEICEENIKK